MSGEKSTISVNYLPKTKACKNWDNSKKELRGIPSSRRRIVLYYSINTGAGER